MSTSTPAAPTLVFPSKPVGAIAPLNFPFLDLVEWGETLVMASFTNVVYSGVDTNPAAMLMFTTPGTPRTTLVLQVDGGVSGVVYQISCKATGSSGNVYQLAGLLAVVP